MLLSTAITSGMISCKADSVKSLAAVQDMDDKWGYIDKTGRLVVPCTWQLAGDFSDDVDL